MELRHLRYFVVVAEELHFNRAAERLHIQQPPLSTQIRQLERELDVQLFERTTRSVRLTEAGTVFLEKAREILDLVEVLPDVARRASKGITGQLTIGFSGSATYSALPIVARIFRDEFPHASLDTQGELLSTPLIEGLLHRRFDVCFGRVRFGVPELDSRLIRDEELSVFLASDHPLADQTEVQLSDLAHDDFVTPNSRAGSAIYETTIQACLDAGFFPNIVQETSETATLVSLVAGGFGVALAPESVRHLNITGAVHRRLAAPRAHTELRIIWRRADQSPLLRRFLTAVESRKDELLL